MTRVFLMRLAGAAVLAMMAAMLITLRPAAAATLKPSALVTTDLVTLGDLFEGAGALAATPVFRAPDAGVVGALPAAAAIAAAKAAGLDVPPVGFDSVRVIRAGTEIGEEMILDLVRTAIASRLKVSADALDVTLDGMADAITADASAEEPVTLASLSIQSGSGRFSARFAVDVGAETRTVDFSGRAVETEEVVVLKRSLDRREVIRENDVALARVERRRIGRGAGLDLAAVVGKAATRALRAGDPVIATDVESPRVVGRGELVTLTYERPGLSLTAADARSPTAPSATASPSSTNSRAAPSRAWWWPPASSGSMPPPRLRPPP